MSIERASYFQYRHYSSALPLLRDGVDAKRHPVVIVGAGAVGLCLELGLARQGIASVGQAYGGRGQAYTLYWSDGRAARNESDYRGVPASDSVAADGVAGACDLLREVRAWLATHRPDLKPQPIWLTLHLLDPITRGSRGSAF